MKRLVCPVLVLIVVALVLVSCGPTPPPPSVPKPHLNLRLDDLSWSYYTVYRLVDREYDTVCYISFYSGVAIDCMPLEGR